MIGVFDVDHERMRGRMVTVVRTPVAAAHLFMLRPPVESAESEVIENQPLAGADELWLNTKTPRHKGTKKAGEQSI